MNRLAEKGETSDAVGATRTDRVPIRTDDGDVFRADVYTAIDVVDDPGLQEQLVDGSLNEVEGPEGRRQYRPAVAVRYHDPANRVYALVVPEQLRHRTFELRRDLLEDLSNVDENLPDYVVNFAVVCDPSELVSMSDTESARSPSVPEAEPAADFEAEEAPEIGGLSGGDDRRNTDQGVAALDERREELERREEELETREAQLEEVRDRVNRERGQLREEFEAERQELEETREELKRMRDDIEREREELEEERQALQAERLNLEDKSRRLERSGPEEQTEFSTQVVTDDQFISVAPQESEDGGAESSRPDRAPQTTEARATELDRDSVPGTFDRTQTEDGSGYVEVSGGRVRARASIADDRIEAFSDPTPRLFIQCHRVDETPVPALTLALVDDQDQIRDAIGWPLDLDDDVHNSVIHRLSEAFELDVVLHDREGSVRAAYEFRAPFEENVDWIRNRVEQELEELDEPAEFSEVAEAFRDDEFELVGEMRHNFDRDAFRDLDSASRVKLAAGVVGYWSEDEQLDYLISNRTYPLEQFRHLQDDVVEAALDFGIYLPEPLRERAEQMGTVADDVGLVERLLANFAEVGIQIRDNDLDPIDEWENWDRLIDFAREVGVTPDPEVIELAEASLQRAKDFQEAEEAESEASSSGETPAEEPSSEADSAGSGTSEGGAVPSMIEAEEQVVGKRSEKTGVMYYLPNSAVIDTFDDFAEMSREDLEKLLDDPNGRLEAAEMLVDQYDTDVVPTVMEAAEQMSAPELTALAQFLESTADKIEAELVRAVEAGGPSAIFVASRALSEIGNTEALGDLVEAYRDPERPLNREAVGRALASYGEALLPALTSSIEEDGVDDSVVTLLIYLDDEHDGILDDLEGHDSEAVREAAARTRDQKL